MANFSTIKVSGWDYECKYCGKHDYVLRRTEKEAIESARDHDKWCHKNPENAMCGSCSHFEFAKKLDAKEDDYEYGIPDSFKKQYFRLCNYVDNVVHAGCGVCKYWKPKETKLKGGSDA